MKLARTVAFALLPAALGLAALACSLSSPSTGPSTSAPSPPPATSSPLAQTQAAPEGDLELTGPWWTFSTSVGFFAINPDGSGLTRFYPDEILPPHVHRIQASASGGHLAFLTGNGIYNTTLHVVSFPDLAPVAEKALTSEDSEPGPGASPGDPSGEAVRAMIDAPSLAFSPDGRDLAFMGAIQGPTSDLYVLSLATGDTTRLTDGPSQGYQPVWSPDGRYIVHTGVRTFGSGAGYAMEGIWAAQADDSGVVTLYDPSDSGAEQVLGWVDNTTFVVHSWDTFCGPNNLRLFDVGTQQSVVLWPEYFQSVAFDPLDATALAAVSSEECNSDGQAGLFSVPADGRAPLRFVEDKARRVTWSPEAELFLASTEFGVLAIDSDGQFVDLDVPQGAEGLPAVAAGSRDLAWRGQSLWVGPLLGSIDNPPREVFAEPVYRATWDPSGQSILFFADRGLYVAVRPEFTPKLVAEGLHNRNGYAGWVMP